MFFITIFRQAIPVFFRFTDVKILFQSIRSDLLGVDEGFERNAIAQVSNSFLRKMIKDDERPFLIDDPKTLGRSFQTLFGPFSCRSSQVILGDTESRFVLGAVKHNSAFSTVTRVNISMESKSPCKKGSFVSFIK